MGQERIGGDYKTAPFSRHPDVGLVGMTDAELQVELEKLVID